MTALVLNSLRSNSRHPPNHLYSLGPQGAFPVVTQAYTQKVGHAGSLQSMVEAPQLQEAWEGQDTLDPKVQFCTIPNPHEKILTSPSGS